MLSNLLMMKSIVTTEVEWKDFAALSKDAYDKIVAENDRVEFVKAKQYNDNWVKLDLKAIDVVNSKLLLLLGNEVITYDRSHAMKAITNASKDGLLNFFECFEKIKQWINGGEEVRKTVLNDAKAEAEWLKLPLVLNNALSAVFNSEWSTNEIKEFFKNTNINLDVFCIFPQEDKETFEVQGQYFFKMTNGKMCVTSVLKFKKDSDGIITEGFEEDEVNVARPCTDGASTTVEVERQDEERQVGDESEKQTDELVTEGEGTRTEVVVETGEQTVVDGEDAIDEDNADNLDAVDEETTDNQDTVEENQEVTTENETGTENNEETVVKNDETTDADNEKKGMSGWIVAVIVVACVSIGILSVIFIWRNVTKSNKV